MSSAGLVKRGEWNRRGVILIPHRLVVELHQPEQCGNVWALLEPCRRI